MHAPVSVVSLVLLALLVMAIFNVLLLCEPCPSLKRMRKSICFQNVDVVS